MTDTPVSDTATLASLNGGKRRSITQVDVHHAEAEFTQLERDLSTPTYDDHANSSTPQPDHLHKDPEKAPEEDEAEERFDLREYLTSSNDANQAAGIKHKHVGVTWEDLEVSGIGGEDNKVNHLSHYTPPTPLTFLLDFRPYLPRCHFGNPYVSSDVGVGSGFSVTPSEAHNGPSDTYDCPQVSLIPDQVQFDPTDDGLSSGTLGS